MEYDKPATLGPLTLRNRIIMGSMHVGLEEMKTLDALAAFYHARARGNVGLIITGGIGPNAEGALYFGASLMTTEADAQKHRVVTDAVHEAGGKIAMQILHAGRYAKTPTLVAPSPIPARINPTTPRELTSAEVEATIDDFVRAAELAQMAGYDGVEIMGSEGYLINQFLVTRTNQRDDEWGGNYENRMRFAIEIAKRTRARVGTDFALIFRLSIVDLVEDGSSWEEVIELAHALEAAGIDAFNSGIGWHEARIPTIVGSVPPNAFLDYTAALRAEVNIPVIAANRFYDPVQIDAAITSGQTDFVAMARPFLADANFALKLHEPKNIVPCIACNQACLDHIFVGKPATCLVNPRAGREAKMVQSPAETPKTFAVIGAGPAGMAAAIELRERGHNAVVFEAKGMIGGQLDLARRIPGKGDFDRLLDYYRHQVERLGITIESREPKRSELVNFDGVILSTGVRPRIPEVKGIDGKNVALYDRALTTPITDQNIVIMGSGPIGFDVASALVETGGDDIAAWRKTWGVAAPKTARSGLVTPAPEKSNRRVTMLQRSTTRFGKSLGKTTGWVHKARLDMAGVEMIGGVEYREITDNGIAITVDGEARFIEADLIVVAAGQESVVPTDYDDLNIPVHIIGGAKNAKGIDAQRAIADAVGLASTL